MKVAVANETVPRYCDEALYENLKNLRARVEKKWDGLIYIGGYEGDGKSTFAGQIAIMLDPTYNLSRCVFTPQQFVDAVNNAKPYECIVYDEAQEVFDSFSQRDPQARVIKNMLTRIRRKQLFIIIVAPDFWRINKYMFIQRSLCFIRVYSTGLERGFFAFYSRERKQQLYVKGKREENIHVVEANFRGRFTNWFPLDENEYDNKKEQAEKEAGKALKGTEEERIGALDKKQKADAQIAMVYWLAKNRYLKNGAIAAAAEHLGMTRQNLRLRGKNIEFYQGTEDVEA